MSPAPLPAKKTVPSPYSDAQSSQPELDTSAAHCIILGKVLTRLASLPDVDPQGGSAKAVEPSSQAAPAPIPPLPPSEVVAAAVAVAEPPPRTRIDPGSLERVLALLGEGPGGGAAPLASSSSHLAALQSQAQTWLASASSWPPIPWQLLPPTMGPVAAAGPVLSRCTASCSEEGPIRLGIALVEHPEYPGMCDEL